MGFQEVGGDLRWIYVAQDTDKWRAVVNMVIRKYACTVYMTVQSLVYCYMFRRPAAIIGEQRG
jgi:hypothetical protein